MGKLLHKLVHGIMPSWLFHGFRRTYISRKKLLQSKLRHGIFNKPSAPPLPSSSAPSNTKLVDLLIDMDQSIYYYSQSEGEQEQPITGNSNHMSSPTVESKNRDDDDEQIHASHNPTMGICALAATSIIQGRWHHDKAEPLPSTTNKEIECPASPASINLQSQHDNDDHQHKHQQEVCLDHSGLIEHQTTKLATSSRETGIVKEDQHGNGYCGHGCHHQHQHQHLHDKDGRTKSNMRSCPLSSLANSAKMGNQHDYAHHHPRHHQHCNQCQNNDQYYQHNASNTNYHQPCLGFKRKSICMDEDGGKEHLIDENNYLCSISAWPCIKRQRTHEEGEAACVLPDCITEEVGDGCAVMQYSYKNPQFAFWESMVQMIVSNELRDRRELEFLLHCYLALNEPHLHHTIHTTFIQVLKDLQQSLLLWAAAAADC